MPVLTGTWRLPNKFRTPKLSLCKIPLLNYLRLLNNFEKSKGLLSPLSLLGIPLLRTHSRIRPLPGCYLPTSPQHHPQPLPTLSFLSLIFSLNVPSSLNLSDLPPSEPIRPAPLKLSPLRIHTPGPKLNYRLQSKTFPKLFRILIDRFAEEFSTVIQTYRLRFLRFYISSDACWGGPGLTLDETGLTEKSWKRFRKISDFWREAEHSLEVFTEQWQNLFLSLIIQACTQENLMNRFMIIKTDFRLFLRKTPVFL